MAWLSGWQYRREVVIRELSGSDLTDFQVRIELDGSNFDFSKANADGSDIRFTDDQGNLLPYWIEEWDSGNQRAVVWVKVPYIPANGAAKIYMYYGNPSATDASDGEAVFEFFDDFESTSLDTNKWGGGVSSWSISGGVVSTGVSQSYVYSKSFTITDGIVEAKVKIDAGARGSLHARSTASSIAKADSLKSYNINYRYPNGDVRSRYWPQDTEVVLDAKTYSHDTDWHIARLKLDGSQITFEYEKLDGTNKYSYTTTHTALTSGYIGFASDLIDSGKVYYDWIRVRKFADPEPSITIGVEEQPWLDGWSFRRAITITEQSGADLTDFQVKVELTESNFPDWDKVNADGSDLRFTDSDGTTLLSHWIEEFDPVNKHAVIWVKVPHIPANGTATIYMYYGNSGAADASDGDATFEFFDDFEGTSLDTNKWGDNNLVSISDSIATLDPDGNSGAWLYTSGTFDVTAIIAEAKAELSNEYGSWAEQGIGFSDGTGENLRANNEIVYLKYYDDGSEELMTSKDGSGTEVKIGEITAGAWHVYGVTGHGGTARVFVDYVEKASTTSNVPSGTLKLCIVAQHNLGGVLQVDWVRVRKYADPEPTVSVSTTREDAVINVYGKVTLPDGTPVGGAVVVALRQDDNVVDAVAYSNSDGTFTLTVFKYKRYSIIAYPPSDTSQNGDIKAHIQT